MSETRPTVNVRVPKTLLKQMNLDGFSENFGYYLEEIYLQKPRKYVSGVIVD